jgi:hypothetical protein
MSEAVLPPAAQRVQALLRDSGSDCTVTMLAATARSAADAAAAIGCTVAQIAKSLVFRSAGGRAVLVIASGTNRVDEGKIAAALGEKIGKADADFVRDRHRRRAQRRLRHAGLEARPGRRQRPQHLRRRRHAQLRHDPRRQRLDPGRLHV